MPARWLGCGGDRRQCQRSGRRNGLLLVQTWREAADVGRETRARLPPAWLKSYFQPVISRMVPKPLELCWTLT
jgi:hypothetical protein